MHLPTPYPGSNVDCQLQGGENGNPRADWFVNRIVSLNARELPEKPLEQISKGGQVYRHDYTTSEGQRLNK